MEPVQRIDEAKRGYDHCSLRGDDHARPRNLIKLTLGVLVSAPLAAGSVRCERRPGFMPRAALSFRFAIRVISVSILLDPIRRRRPESPCDARWCLEFHARTQPSRKPSASSDPH